MTATTARPGPNDVLPCKTESARYRHLARGQVCHACGVSVGPPPAPKETAA